MAKNQIVKSLRETLKRSQATGLEGEALNESREHQDLNRNIRTALIFISQNPEDLEVLKGYGFIEGDFYEAVENLITDVENYEE